MTHDNSILVARRVIQMEIDGMDALASMLGDSFTETAALILALKGHVVMAGVGKSGHIARKISATMASTGTPSLFVHPTEASHGDMGMITSADCVIALSRSGETKELADMIGYCKRFSVPLIAMTCKEDSALARAANIVLLLPAAPEACAVTGAPTTSTIVQLAMGDALAVALLEARGFTPADFKTFHPGGALGAQLAVATDLMHSDMPLVDSGADMQNALAVLGKKGFGCTGITDKNGILVGIITDGDIRRNLHRDITALTAADLMTKSPKTIGPDILAADALRLMTAGSPKIMQMFVVHAGKPIGIIHMHDLLRAGLA